MSNLSLQGRQDADFPERLFTYNYRLHDRYRLPVASLAVLADEREDWKPNGFSYHLFGCDVGIRDSARPARHRNGPVRLQ